MVVGVDVNIDNPDENIFLGVEAKVYVHMEKAQGAVTLPLEAVCSDMEGDFVFVEENGIVGKKRVTVGISSDSICEIKEGLTAGESVLLPGMTGIDLVEGMNVTVMP